MRDIGIEANPPSKECKDEHCPWHSPFPIRGRTFEGKVISIKPNKTAIIEREYLHYLPKYERYERRKSKIYAHNPPCILAKVGDKVRVVECKPISKLKHYVVIEIL